MRRVIEASLRLRFLVLALVVVVVLAAVDAVEDMPVDVYPEFNPPFVEVQTEALGLSAAEMESLITVPLEADLLNGVAWLDRITSKSVAGLSSILLHFEPGTDPLRARQMVQERLTQTFALPNVSKPPTMLQPLSTSSRVMMVGLSSKDLSLIDLGVLARWNIRPRLMGVPGVANVAIWGQRERQLQVHVDPKQLHARGVTLAQVVETAGNALWVSPLSYLNASTPGTAGWIDTPNQRLGLHHRLPISSPEDLANVSVASHHGVLLGDVATVVEDHQPLIGDAQLREGPGLMLVIEKFPGADTLTVTEEVEGAIDAMRPGLAGVDIDTTIFRPATYIEQAIGNLGIASLLGALLMVLVLIELLNGWRAAMLCAVAVPLSLLAAGLVLAVRGSTINAMVIAGLVIAIGAVVDDVIVDVENIVRRFRQYREAGSDRPPASVVLEAVLDVRRPIVFATLVILLVVLPVFFLPGSSGAFFRPLVLSAVLAVGASLVVALTVTPVLSFVFLRAGPAGRGSSHLLLWLQDRYWRMLARMLRMPRLISGIVVAIAVVVLLAAPFLRVSLRPTFKQTDLLVQWEAAPGTSRLEMNRITARASQELRTIPGVRSVGSHVGRAVTGDRIAGINAGELWVSLDPAAEYDATVAAVRDVMGGYPGILRAVRPYEPARTAEALADTEENLIVRVYGSDMHILRSKATDVQERLSTIDGIVTARAVLPVEEPQVEIEVDLAAAERHQIKPGDVRRQATTLLSGLQVGNLFEEQKVFDVVVWGAPETRDNPAALRDLLIDTPRGPVRLEEIAAIRTVPTPVVIQRDAVSRYVDVSAAVRGRNLGAIERGVRDALARVDFPLEYHAEVFGTSAAQRSAAQRLVGVVAAALIGVFLLLQAAFASWRSATLLLVATPAALVGGVLVVLAGGGTLSLGSLVGLLAVLGISVRQGTVLISRWTQLEQKGELVSPALILHGAQERLTPILTTAVAIGVALGAPLLFGDSAGLEIVRPAALVMLGGLVSATLITLFGLPTLYLRLRRSSR